MMRTLWRYLWAAPYSLAGLTVGVLMLGSGGTCRRDAGIMEISGGRWAAWLERQGLTRGFAAITLGHVVLAVSASAMTQLRSHERIHVLQYERWGVLFGPAYLLSSLMQWLRGRDPYRDNHFECEAFARQ